MKKINYYALAFCMLLFVQPFTMNANSLANAYPVEIVKTEDAARATTLLKRLNAIKATNISKINSLQKETLRNEVASIYSQLKVIGDGIYISAGALIVILLLLIILL